MALTSENLLDSNRLWWHRGRRCDGPCASRTDAQSKAHNINIYQNFMRLISKIDNLPSNSPTDKSEAIVALVQSEQIFTNPMNNIKAYSLLKHWVVVMEAKNVTKLLIQ